jgi:hypothetical protein
MADDVFSNKFGLSLGLALMLAVAVFFMYGHSTMACAETQHLTGNILDQHDLIEHPKQVEKKTLDDSLPKLIQRERELENSIDNWTQKKSRRWATRLKSDSRRTRSWRTPSTSWSSIERNWRNYSTS